MKENYFGIILKEITRMINLIVLKKGFKK
jgi:hypothetical protein